MTKDINKGINSVTYNHLNQPVEIQKSADDRTEYLYTATGIKLQTKIFAEGKWQNTTDYAGAYVYVNDELNFINIPGGRIVAENNEYQYHLTDHLGNVRVTFKDSSGIAKIIQEDHYYPFGMRMNGQHFSNTELLNKYLYNGKEQQDQTGWYAYGFRQLDPQLGRWHVSDAMAERFLSESPYAYVNNNPISYRDYMGLTTWADINGIINDLMNSDHGGTWSSGGGISYFGSGGEAMDHMTGGGGSGGSGDGGGGSSMGMASLKGGFWRTGFGKGVLNFFGYNVLLERPGNDVVVTWKKSGWDDLTFDKLWDNYPSSSIKHIDPKTGKDIFGDHCAINVSEALERSGVDLSSSKGWLRWLYVTEFMPLFMSLVIAPFIL